MIESHTMGLLTTCRRINMEASAVLYGSNEFTFYSEYFKNCGTFQCRYCNRHQRNDDYHSNYDHPSNDHPNDGRSRDSQFAHVYAFLSSIGKENRLRIRTLLIKFSAGDFRLNLSERKTASEEDLHQDDLARGLYIGRAMELFSYAHNLSTITLMIDDCQYRPSRDLKRIDRDRDEKDFKRAKKLLHGWFHRNPPRLQLVQQIKKVQGIDKLVIQLYNDRSKYLCKVDHLEHAMLKKTNLNLPDMAVPADRSPGNTTVIRIRDGRIKKVRSTPAKRKVRKVKKSST